VQDQPIDLARLESMPVLDEAAIEVLRDPGLGGDPEFLVEVVEAFLADTPPRLEVLRASLALGDGDGLGRAAHSLKGSSGNFGAARMQALCAGVERLGRAGRLDEVAPLVDLLANEYTRVATRLTELALVAGGQPVSG
jgi:HPt (histidine-containing phosphotransfer) domain-containing protein